MTTPSGEWPPVWRFRGPGILFLLVLGVTSVALNFYGATSLASHQNLDTVVCGGDGPSSSTTTSLSFPGLQTTASTPISVFRINTTVKPPRLFHCNGGMAQNRNFLPVLVSLFPEYQWVDLSSSGYFDQTNGLDAYQESSPFDLFVSNWRLDECNNNPKSNQIYQWLQLYFQGKVLFLNPEDATLVHHILPRPQYFELGPGIARPNRHVFYFLQAAFWAQMNTQDKQKLLNHNRPNHHHDKALSQDTDNTQRRHFLIYAHSHCVGIRQAAFRQIANLGLPDPAYYGGRCDGGVKKNTTKAQKYPNQVRLRNWEDNRHVYQEFRFCLTMEHVTAPGYITEKILLAYWAGCIPIYYGTLEIFDIFHKDSFIFYDVDHPQEALDQIRYLEQNRSAYQDMLKRPILADGAAEKYFSLDDTIGGGALKAQIRRFLNLDGYLFT
jgi:hypothetical protein